VIFADRMLGRKHGHWTSTVQRTADSRDVPEITTAWMEMRLLILRRSHRRSRASYGVHLHFHGPRGEHR